ncbi:MAG: hypothetical protein NT069_10455 [Planctomycetota bacterium]|nr:hypothetical protein [Planctomycetota bacterium]
MTIEQLRSAHRAQPFKPFVLHLADGRELPVHHPDFLAPSPSGRTVLVYQPDDTSNVVDLLLVTDLEFRPLDTGSTRRKKN